MARIISKGFEKVPRIYIVDCPHCNFEIEVEQIWYDYWVKCALDLCRYCEREFIAVFRKAECDVCDSRIDCLCWKFLYVEEEIPQT